MDIKSLATQVLMQKFGGNTDQSVAQSALDDLAGGDDKVAAFASKLGVDSQEDGNKLSEPLPTLIDKSSRGGNLLVSVGGIKGLRGLASRIFK